ncbi:MAG: GtrA family protein [Bacilli bacterium]|nr:GtrA family protein [Bacilli bacterium]
MKNNKLLIQIFKFIIVGGIATIIDYIIFFILHELLKLGTLPSNIISFSISVIYNYIASVKWVFDVKKDDPKKQFIIFIVLSIIGLLLNTAIVYVTVDIFKWYSMLCKIIATGIVMVFNFITRKLLLEKPTR